MIFLLLLLLLFPSSALAYGTFGAPCSATSYWNKLIQTGADRYAPATVNGANNIGNFLTAFRIRPILIHQMSGGDPLLTLAHRVCPTAQSTICNTGTLWIKPGSTCQTSPSGSNRVHDTGDYGGLTIRLPSSFNVTEVNRDNPFVWVDGNDVRECIYFERCTSSPTAPACRYFPSDNTTSSPVAEAYNITGTCMPAIGSAAGSDLPLLPGVIREGELI